MRTISRPIARLFQIGIVKQYRLELDAFPFDHALSFGNRLKTGLFAVLIKALWTYGMAHSFEVRPVAVPLPELLM